MRITVQYHGPLEDIEADSITAALGKAALSGVVKTGAYEVTTYGEAGRKHVVTIPCAQKNKFIFGAKRRNALKGAKV